MMTTTSGRWRRSRARSFRCVVALGLALGAGLGGGCGPRFDLGSDVIWSATHEGGTFDEWTGDSQGSVQVFPASSLAAISTDHAHRGLYSAELTITTDTSADMQTASLSRQGTLPAEAYYSAWFYLPRSVTVGIFWVIFKFRYRQTADDATTSNELYDLDLVSLDNGEMSVILYDHRTTANVPLAVSNPIVPVGIWFQVEAFYRNASDDTGRVTYWLDGQQIVDVTGKPTGPNAWVQWEACSIGEDLTPSTSVIYVDDAAISLARVGPDGIITE